ncbi:MAG: hypothetical protein ASARMPRED_009072 [Alectoria sarmentosa]|nr:MAG: hypothetical protein ASARMPRED_009072 [Alectoria sarmentosa]
MTEAGLNTVNLSQMNTFQQFILFLLILLGSAIWVSIAVVHVRRKAFERRFKSIVEEERQRRRNRSTSRRRLSLPSSRSQSRPEVDGAVVQGRVITSENGLAEESDGHLCHPDDQPQSDCNTSLNTRRFPKPESGAEYLGADNLRFDSAQAGQPLSIDTGVTRRITFAPPSSPTRERQHGRILSMQGIGARQSVENHPINSPRPIYFDEVPRADEGNAESRPLPQHGIWSGAFVGRNSQFSNLSLAEREKIGGVEYRAVTYLAVIVPLYFVLWQLLGCIGLGAYVASKRASTAEVNAENPWWVGAFNGVSAFNNSGMSLLDANMVAFQTSDYMLITMGLMILAGNTCYPVFLRLIIWTLSSLLPDNEKFLEHKITLRFLLDHPRRCYTNLFPARHTWWLLATLVVLNGTDWVAFEVLNIGNSTVTSLPSGSRALDGFFQALAVRSGGFYVVSIANLRIGLLILYVIMMYISAYPVLITMRNSNVYEERSLGIYADDPQAKQEKDSNQGVLGRLKRTLTNQRGSTESRSYFVRQQLRGQLAHDLWWIVLAILFITITETSQFERDPVAYSVFNVIFEVVSGYGCVGISVGLPNVAYSFCGGWHTLSKLILCAVMLRGRHRGLPVAIDRAVLLPGEHLAAAEEEDAQIRLDRTTTMNKGNV